MTRYAARLQSRLDEPLSRWLWLVKWLLLIPHYIVLFFLGIGFFVVTVIAFFAILVTGRSLPAFAVRLQRGRDALVVATTEHAAVQATRSSCDDAAGLSAPFGP